MLLLNDLIECHIFVGHFLLFGGFGGKVAHDFGLFGEFIEVLNTFNPGGHILLDIWTIAGDKARDVGVVHNQHVSDFEDCKQLRQDLLEVLFVVGDSRALQD